MIHLCRSATCHVHRGRLRRCSGWKNGPSLSLCGEARSKVSRRHCSVRRTTPRPVCVSRFYAGGSWNEGTSKVPLSVQSRFMLACHFSTCAPCVSTPPVCKYVPLNDDDDARARVYTRRKPRRPAFELAGDISCRQILDRINSIAVSSGGATEVRGRGFGLDPRAFGPRHYYIVLYIRLFHLLFFLSLSFSIVRTRELEKLYFSIRKSCFIRYREYLLIIFFFFG